jgi:transcriptional regulator with XRE-family HTH domain
MPHPIDLALAQRIRGRRHVLGLTQVQVAASIGLTFQTVQKYECAANALTTRRIVDVAKALEWTPAELVSGLERVR